MTLIEYKFANRRKSNRTVLNEFKITLNIEIKMHFDLNIFFQTNKIARNSQWFKFSAENSLEIINTLLSVYFWSSKKSPKMELISALSSLTQQRHSDLLLISFKFKFSFMMQQYVEADKQKLRNRIEFF